MKVIVISGTPGTGKTTLAKKLSKELKYKLIDISKLIKEKKLSSGFDKKRKSEIVDVKKLNKELVKIISKKENLIIEGHLSHYLSKKYVNKCIITTCDIKELSKRLKKRKYSASKIKENLEAEIFEIILIEANELKHDTLVVNTSKKYNIKEIVKEI